MVSCRYKERQQTPSLSQESLTWQLTVSTCNEAEADRQFGWYLADEVPGQAAGLQAGVLHQEEDGVWDLCQLTFTQVCNDKA